MPLSPTTIEWAPRLGDDPIDSPHLHPHSTDKIDSDNNVIDGIGTRTQIRKREEVIDEKLIPT